MKSLPLARLVMYVSVAYRVLVLSTDLVESLKSSPLISVSLYLLHNCPSSRQIGWQIFGFLWFQLHCPISFLLVDDQYVVSLFSLHCQFTFTFFLSPADEERSGNSWNSFSNDLLFSWKQILCESVKNILPFSQWYSTIFDFKFNEGNAINVFLMHSLCLPACPSHSVSVR